MYTTDNTTMTNNSTMTDNYIMTDNSTANDSEINISIIVGNSIMYNPDNDNSLNDIILKAMDIIRSNVNIKIINDDDAKIIDDAIVRMITVAKILIDIIARIKGDDNGLGDFDLTNNTATSSITALSSANTPNPND